MATIAYARVSTDMQDVALQLDALQVHGYDKLFTDEDVSGKLDSRPALDAAMACLQPGDTFLIWKLDRLGRSVLHLITVLNDFRARGIEFKSLTNNFDTTTAQGRMVYQICAAFAEYEREMIVERTRAGLAAAKRRGVKLGRKAALDASQIATARMMVAANIPVAHVAKALKVSRPTVYRALG